GNIWRVDMPIVYNDNIDDRDHWIAYKFAELGRHASSTTDDDRRFFHKVDVVFSRDSSDPVSRFDAVIVGSGNRANPKDMAYTDIPQNRLFMLKDRSISVVDYSASNPPSALTASSLSNLTDNCFADDSCTDAVKTNLINGWYLNLREEEKMLSSSLTLAGTIFATTYIPTGGLANNSCGPNEGTGFLYAIKLSDATSARINFHLSIDEDPQTESANRIYELGSGIPSSPVAIGDGKVLLPGGKIVKAGDSDGGLTYWYEDNSR
ncbi:MAG: hypothetical protein KAI17_02790, partial [Thiotrichaceae bacterium]|nr:hypothetical protein [Thiotrichaceae bacterium]